METEAQQAFIAVGNKLVGATNSGNEAVALAAMTIARLVQNRGPQHGLPIDAGDKDVLPALHDALGSALQTATKLNKARLIGFGRARELGLWEDFGDMCPCGEGPPPKGELFTEAAVVVPFPTSEPKAA